MNYHQAEENVAKVLKSNPSPVQLDAALEQFLNSRVNRYEQHGYWVHSLSHFMDKLYKLGRLDWVKRFNEVAFRGANELGDSNCSDRLIGDFVEHGTFDLDPAEFHFTADSLRWMKWSEYSVYHKARIEHGRFNSVEDMRRFELSWKLLNQGDSFIFFKREKEDAECQLDVSRLESALQELQSLGTDMREFEGIGKRLLTAKLAKLQAELKEAPTKYPHPNVLPGLQKSLAEQIKLVEVALAG